jgi:hypothetical protein
LLSQNGTVRAFVTGRGLAHGRDNLTPHACFHQDQFRNCEWLR